jgi:hypothetical protein
MYGEDIGRLEHENVELSGHWSSSVSFNQSTPRFDVAYPVDVSLPNKAQDLSRTVAGSALGAAKHSFEV